MNTLICSWDDIKYVQVFCSDLAFDYQKGSNCQYIKCLENPSKTHAVRTCKMLFKLDYWLHFNSNGKPHSSNWWLGKWFLLKTIQVFFCLLIPIGLFTKFNYYKPLNYLLGFKSNYNFMLKRSKYDLIWFRWMLHIPKFFSKICSEMICYNFKRWWHII